MFYQNKKVMYLCIISFHHASHLNSDPGWNFCFSEYEVQQAANKHRRLNCTTEKQGSDYR